MDALILSEPTTKELRRLEGPLIPIGIDGAFDTTRKRIRPFQVWCEGEARSPITDFTTEAFVTFREMPYLTELAQCGWYEGGPADDFILSMGCFHLTFSTGFLGPEFTLCFIASHGLWEDVGQDIIDYALVPAMVTAMEQQEAS